MRLLVIGASSQPICGVRDCARALEPALTRAGAAIETVWWERASGETGHAFAERATASAHAHRADATLWHYSVFTYGRRGVPFDVPFLARALARPAPLVGFLHELATDWTGRGVRSAAQAAAQRVALRLLLRTLAAAVVTTDERASSLAGRLPVLSVPVPSNVPPVAEPSAGANGLRVGVFGFRSARVAAETVVAGIAAVPARLVLVGAPGANGAEADRWRAAAAEAGCAVEFTGILDPPELSRALGTLDVVVFPDPTGPSARRGTLAAALAHGRPVVGFDGPLAWRELVDEGGATVVPLDAALLARALRELEDTAVRSVRGAAARAFYERAMAPAVVARRLLAFVEESGR